MKWKKKSRAWAGANFDFRISRLRKYRQACADVPERSGYESPYPVKLGILKCFTSLHVNYVRACEELKVSYEVIDLAAEDWMDRVQKCRCDLFLFWPAVVYSYWKRIGDERIRIISEWMKKPVYPSFEEVWIHESKSRMHYWLQQNGIPHPQTWVFYDEWEALSFADTCALPVVFKSDMGSGASGVKICRDRTSMRRLIKKAFRKGIVNWMQGPRDRQIGFVVFQEYLDVVAEWRILGFGDSYFGRQKKKVGEFHSGSRDSVWETPPEKLLNFVHEINLRHGLSGDMDVFETRSGDYLVNEIQPVFGCSKLHQMLVNGKPGRFTRDLSGWRFEEGVFTQYACSTLRVVDAMRKTGIFLNAPTWEKESNEQASPTGR